MRIQREKQYPGAACFGQGPDLGFGRRIAVAHAEIDDHVIAKPGLHRDLDRRRLCLGDGQKRAFVILVVPD